MTFFKLSLFDHFGNNVLLRSKMKDFFKFVNSAASSKVFLDFSNISFISRSCADEYLNLKRNSNKRIEEVKMTESVSNMIDLVERSKRQLFVLSKEKKHSYVLR